MKIKIDPKKFKLYRYNSDNNLLVAVASEYLPKIEHALEVFGNFKEIPSDWEVRGIFIDPSETVNLDSEAQQSEIVLNCLEAYE